MVQNGRSMEAERHVQLKRLEKEKASLEVVVIHDKWGKCWARKRGLESILYLQL